MKKIFLIFVAVVFAFISCEKETVLTSSEETVSESGIVYNLSAIHSGTKAVKTAWETNDVIYVFFSSQAAPKYVEMKWNGSAWAFSEKNSFSLTEGDSGTMTAVFLPFGSDATVSADGTSFVFDKTYYSYYMTAQLAYTVSGNKVTGTFNMAIPDGFMQFFVNKADASVGDVIELREPKLTPSGITSIAADGTVSTSTLATGAPLPGYVYDKESKESGESKGYLFSGILAADARNVASDYCFTLVSGGINGNYYNKTFASQTFYRGVASGRAVKLPEVANWTAITANKPIDIKYDLNGKRIYWASSNIGATNPENYGNYYSWAETETKTTYFWGQMKYGTGTDAASAKMTKYCTNAKWGTVDGKSSLDPEDDVAHVTLGNGWRLPTDPELVALRNNFTWTWTTQGGINGYLVENNDDASLSIFLPAGGSKQNTSYNGVGTVGYYWGNGLRASDNRMAYGLYFNSTSNARNANGYSRCLGFMIRPVTE